MFPTYEEWVWQKWMSEARTWALVCSQKFLFYLRLGMEEEAKKWADRSVHANHDAKIKARCAQEEAMGEARWHDCM